MTRVDAGRAIISGAGPAGLCAALELSVRGWDVKIVERRPLHPTTGGRRFQAVILDQIAISILARLGVSIDKVCTPIRGAIVNPRLDAPDTLVHYHKLNESQPDFGTGDDYAPILGRRQVVGIASIGELEAELTTLVRNNPRIKQLYGNNAIDVSFNGYRVEVKLDDGHRTRLEGDALIVAEGTKSFDNGTMNLLGIDRISVQDEQTFAVTEIQTCELPGKLVFCFLPGEENMRCTALGQKQSVVLMVEIPRCAPRSDIDSRIHEAARWLGIEAAQVRPFIRFDTGVHHAERLAVENRAFVIGDAAFSGTPILGVYLNKALLDAASVARLCERLQGVGFESNTGKQLTMDFENYRLMQAFPELSRLEEIALLGGRSLAVSGLPNSSELSGLILRSILRMKGGRHDLGATFVLNAVDGAEAVTRLGADLSTRLGSPVLGMALRSAAGGWHQLLDRIGDDVKSDAL